MATRAMPQSRKLDHLYDPLYTTSHAADHHRLTTKAIVKAENWQRLPHQKYMFSELAHYPRVTIRLNQKSDMPEHLDKNWGGAGTADMSTCESAHLLAGSHRYKFHKRPLAPAMNTMNYIVMYEVKNQKKQDTSKKVHIVEEPTRTVGTQSLYRESEAQTDPYAPQYVVPPNMVPEILTLTHLTYGAGLPASQMEVEIIERTRQKRIFENMLPASTDEFSFGLRAKLMEAQELRVWAERERQIEELQSRRLEILKEALEKRDATRLQKGEEKVDRLKKKKQSERDSVLTILQRRRVKILRQTFKVKQALEINETGGSNRALDVIGKHSDFSSDLYAPKMRDGHVPETNTAKIEVQPSDLNSYADLIQLERSLPAHMLRVEMEGGLEPPMLTRKDQSVRKALASAAVKLESRTQLAMDGEVMMGTETKERKVRDRHNMERPETPRVAEDVLPEEEECEMGILLLQRILRGRAAQNRMFEGKEKRLDLINELRTAEGIKEVQEQAQKQGIDQEKSQALFQDEATKAIIENIQGTVVAQTLDDLSKELVRFQEERRIAVMVKLAERDRRLRQAQESGRRQAEERLREREDEMFRQIMGVHQGTMDSYLEDIITRTVDEAAKDRAVEEAKLQASRINEVVDKLEAQSHEHQVKDLVESFMLPHVQREIVKRRIKSIDSQKYRVAAKEALHASQEGINHHLLQ